MSIQKTSEELKEALKEKILGSEAPESVSSESKTTFLKHASLEENGELFMTQDDFIDAIAPPEEDYVRRRMRRCRMAQPLTIE